MGSDARMIVPDDFSLNAASILSDSRKIALPRALYRIEVAIIAIFAAIMLSLSLLNVLWPADLWWIWLLFGIAGAGLIVFLSLRDNAFMLPIIASVYYQKLDTRRFRLLDMRDDLSEGLHYHKLLFDEIAHQRTPLLGPIVLDVDQLLIAMFRVARAIDQFVSDEHVRNYLQSLSPKSSDAHTDTIKDYAALVLNNGGDATASDTDVNAAESEPQRELLRRVYANLIQARGDLQDAIKKLVVAHGKVAGITRADDDFTFIGALHEQLAQQSQRLELRREATEALRKHCEIAAAVYAG